MLLRLHNILQERVCAITRDNATALRAPFFSVPSGPTVLAFFKSAPTQGFFVPTQCPQTFEVWLQKMKC